VTRSRTNQILFGTILGIPVKLNAVSEGKPNGISG